MSTSTDKKRKKRNILGIIQARVASTRLEGKVLKNILGKPMLERQIERVRRAKTITRLVVATSQTLDNNPIFSLCASLGISCFRGSTDDVLDRFFQCTLEYEPDHIVRLTGDCPLIDPDIIDKAVYYHLDGGYDYTSNLHPPTWPDGMDVEVMNFKCLGDLHEKAFLPSEREHVTPFVYKNPNTYLIGNIENYSDQSRFRLTVDEIEDFVLVTKIFTKLYPENPAFKLSDIFKLLEVNPELFNINSQFPRNQGFQNSQKMDETFNKYEK